MLEIKRLCKKFEEQIFLDNVNLSLVPGEISFIVGPSGVGKSTLLKILNNLETADSGLILYDGKISNPKELIEKKITSMMFQSPGLFKYLSTEANLTLILEKVLKLEKNDAKKEALALLKKMEIQDFANKPISKLSGGQQQRLSFARILAIKPKIFCLDEPTSALDPHLTRYIAKEIINLSELGHSFLIVTHDMFLIKILSKCTINLIKAGRIIETGTFDQIQKQVGGFEFIKEFMSL
jgi:ABC-type polar amino acid transport system ATPase subunit